MTTALNRFAGSMPDLNRIYASDLALPSDPDWLRDNPEAVARIRAFRDEPRTDKRVILLTVRVMDAPAPDGWRPAYVEVHSAHWDSPAFKTWQDNPGDMMAANDFALTVLTADADVDAGHALTALGGLVLADLTELPPHWRAQFEQVVLAAPLHNHSKGNRTVSDFSTYTGLVSQTFWGFRADTLDNPIVPDAELNWLRDNPRQVARIRRLEVLLDDELNLIVPTFVFSLRVLDHRVAEGFRLATFSLPGAAPYNFDADVSLDERWPSAEGRSKEENDFVLTALNEAARTGELWAETILRSIVLPDTSALDPEDWALDFAPFQSKT